MTNTFTKEDFLPHLKEEFVFPLKDQDDLLFSLEEVNSLNHHDKNRRAPFSLILKGPAKPQLPQGSYRFDHPVLGALLLFMVPVEIAGDGVLYESLFN